MKSWYLLVHPDPRMIDDLLSGAEHLKSLNNRDTTANRKHHRRAEYFIPSVFLQSVRDMSLDVAIGKDKQPTYNPLMDGNALRSDLRRLIFIHATSKLIDQILRSKWNENLQVRLRHYWNTEHEAVQVSDAEMQLFMSALKVRDFQFAFGQPLERLSKGDKVLVLDGEMKGYEGHVTEIGYKENGLRLKIAFLLFNGQVPVVLPGFSSSQVRLIEPEVDSSPYYEPIIKLFETKLTQLLWLRYGKNKQKEYTEAETRQLKNVLRYSDLHFDDHNDEKIRFTALLLIAAYLLKDKKAVDEYTGILSGILGEADTAKTETECYMMAALFIAHHHPQLRQAAKTYRLNHPNCSPFVCQILSIAKNIRCR